MKIHTELKGGSQGRIIASSIEVNMAFTSVEDYMAWAAKVTALLMPGETPPAKEEAKFQPKQPTPPGRKSKGIRPPMSEEAKRKAAATRARRKAEREAQEDDALNLTEEQIERARAAFADGDDEE